MSDSALEGGAVFEGEHQEAIRVGHGIVQQKDIMDFASSFPDSKREIFFDAA